MYTVLSCHRSQNTCVELSPVRSQLFTLQTFLRREKILSVFQSTLRLSSDRTNSIAGLLSSQLHGITMYFTDHFLYLTNLAKHISEPVIWMV